MKAKCTLTKTAPDALRVYLSSPRFRDHFMREVLGKELRVENATGRPAEHFMQVPDDMIPGESDELGLIVNLSGASVQDGRFFAGALEAMMRLATEIVRQFVPVGTRIQVFCQVATDQPVPGNSSTLLESKPVWVDGNAEAKAEEGVPGLYRQGR